MMRCTLAAGGILFFALIGVTWYTGHVRYNFNNLSEAKTTLTSAGFLCMSDREDGITGTGFLVSREPYPASKACLLCKIGPMGPEWQGKVWVTFNSADWKLSSVPDNAGVRSWGEVIAFGDEQLLREIERRFASPLSL